MLCYVGEVLPSCCTNVHVVAAGDAIFMFGGLGGDGALNDLWKLTGSEDAGTGSTFVYCYR